MRHDVAADKNYRRASRKWLNLVDPPNARFQVALRRARLLFAYSPAYVSHDQSHRL